jgi:hypothetical protein
MVSTCRLLEMTRDVLGERSMAYAQGSADMKKATSGAASFVVVRRSDRLDRLDRSGRRGVDQLDPRAQARQLAGDRIAMQDALDDAALHFRLRRLERFLGSILVARIDRFLDTLHEGPDARDPRVIGLGPPCIAPDALFG